MPPRVPHCLVVLLYYLFNTIIRYLFYLSSGFYACPGKLLELHLLQHGKWEVTRLIARVTSHLLRIRLRNTCHPHINIRDFKPCRIIHDSGLRKIKYLLERPDSLRSTGAIDSVGCQRRNRRIISGDPVQLLLQLTDFSPEEPIVRSYPGQEEGTPEIISAELIYISLP